MISVTTTTLAETKSNRLPMVFLIFFSIISEISYATESTSFRTKNEKVIIVLDSTFCRQSNCNIIQDPKIGKQSVFVLFKRNINEIYNLRLNTEEVLSLSFSRPEITERWRQNCSR
jgi:putative aminopeptidase FrvX